MRLREVRERWLDRRHLFSRPIEWKGGLAAHQLQAGMRLMSILLGLTFRLPISIQRSQIYKRLQHLEHYLATRCPTQAKADTMAAAAAGIREEATAAAKDSHNHSKDMASLVTGLLPSNSKHMGEVDLSRLSARATELTSFRLFRIDRKQWIPSARRLPAAGWLRRRSASSSSRSPRRTTDRLGNASRVSLRGRYSRNSRKDMLTLAPPRSPVGPPEYQQGPVTYQRPQGQTMDNGMRYEYSSMNGKRKALLIGINYVGTSSALRGCWNDIDNMKNFIMQRAGYKADDMVILSDRSGGDPRSIPTRQNMTAAMHWLVSGAQPGDALFFHYSGHGGQAKATQGDEDDGMNETIIPLDYQQAGQMEDDELHELLVRPLPVGCRLTALFDSCHSGTVLDLPFVYATSGKIKEPNVFAGVGKGIMGAAMSYARGDVMGMAKGLFSTFNTARLTDSAEEVTKRTKASGADVVRAIIMLLQETNRTIINPSLMHR